MNYFSFILPMLYFVFLALTASKKSVTRSCLLTVETGWFGIFAKNPNLFYKILLEKNKCEKVVYVPFLFLLSSLDYHWGHESLSLTLLRALKEKRPKKSSNPTSPSILVGQAVIIQFEFILWDRERSLTFFLNFRNFSNQKLFIV